MRKFVVQHVKGTTSIQEIECTKVTPLDDSSVLNLLGNEYKVKIVRPSSLAGEVWFNWALYDSAEIALVRAEQDLVEEAQRNERKHDILYEPLKVLEKVKALRVKML